MEFRIWRKANANSKILIAKPGEMQEWLNWPLSKSGVPKGTKGSNPFLSAIQLHPLGVFLYGGKSDSNPRFKGEDCRIGNPQGDVTNKLCLFD